MSISSDNKVIKADISELRTDPCGMFFRAISHTLVPFMA